MFIRFTVQPKYEAILSKKAIFVGHSVIFGISKTGLYGSTWYAGKSLRSIAFVPDLEVPFPPAKINFLLSQYELISL